MSGEESLSDRLARQARELVETAGSTTGRLARVGRLQLDLLAIRREFQQELRMLGERAFELARRRETGSIPDDPIAGPILRRLERLEADRKMRESQIEAIRSSSHREGESR